MDKGNDIRFGIVAIGRNEGERLRRCMRSLPASARVIYVDSGSSDGSDTWARDFGAEVVHLDPSIPFTAARARNAGFHQLAKLAPEIAWVQFIDGDCELAPDWPETAIRFLQEHPDVAAVFGRRRESNPDASIYNRLCDWEWEGQEGEAGAFGGDVMIKTDVLRQSGGYRESLVAGEEPELCVRLRRMRWRIWRLPAEMTTHDAAITRFSQWWRRTLRSGYAFAEGAYLHGQSQERHWVWQSRRAWIWGIWLPILCFALGLVCGPWGWMGFAIYPLQISRQILREKGTFPERAIKAVFQVGSRFPEALGQLQFLRDRLLGRKALLIEYK